MKKTINKVSLSCLKQIYYLYLGAKIKLDNMQIPDNTLSHFGANFPKSGTFCKIAPQSDFSKSPIAIGFQVFVEKTEQKL